MRARPLTPRETPTPSRLVTATCFYSVYYHVGVPAFTGRLGAFPRVPAAAGSSTVKKDCGLMHTAYKSLKKTRDNNTLNLLLHEQLDEVSPPTLPRVRNAVC